MGLIPGTNTRASDGRRRLYNGRRVAAMGVLPEPTHVPSKTWFHAAIFRSPKPPVRREAQAPAPLATVPGHPDLLKMPNPSMRQEYVDWLQSLYGGKRCGVKA